jgi:hypothetical protein
VDDGHLGKCGLVGNEVFISAYSLLACMPPKTFPADYALQVNPLLRAVELAKSGADVSLMLPWLDPKTLRDE